MYPAETQVFIVKYQRKNKQWAEEKFKKQPIFGTVYVSKIKKASTIYESGNEQKNWQLNFIAKIDLAIQCLIYDAKEVYKY